MKELFNKEITTAMKSGNKFRLDVLRMLKAEILLNEKSDKPRPDEEMVSAYRKKLHKSLELYQTQPETQDRIKKEIAIVDEFLPKAISNEDVEKIVQKHLGLGNAGLIMKAVREEIKGPFDGKLVSEMVNGKLKK